MATAYTVTPNPLLVINSENEEKRNLFKLRRLKTCSERCFPAGSCLNSNFHTFHGTEEYIGKELS